MSEFAQETWRLSGALTVREVPQVFADSRAQFERGGMPAEVDLARVAETDSSALALLLEWASWAKLAGAGTEFCNPPESLQVLADLTDVSELLGWPELGAED